MYKRIVTHGRALDLTGQIFGSLVCLFPVERCSNKIKWLCKCRCGKSTVAFAFSIRSGHTKSCGCRVIDSLVERSTTHCMSNTAEFKIWTGIKTRCYNKNVKCYGRYGGNGIVMHDKWVNNFLAFYEDMGARPTPKHSIDRIDNNGNYTPDNCRWATAEQQSNNKSTNKFITYQNLTLTHAQWCRKFDINVGTMHGRINRGWTEIEAITIPAGVTRKDFHSGSYHVEPSTAPTGSVDVS